MKTPGVAVLQTYRLAERAGWIGNDFSVVGGG